MDRIYFIHAQGLRLIKIGITGDLRKRVQSIQTASPVNLELLAHMPGTRKLERWIQRRLHKVHVRGEWFSDGPEIRAYVDEALSHPQKIPPRPTERTWTVRQAAAEVMRLTALDEEAAYEFLRGRMDIVRALDRGRRSVAGRLIIEAYNARIVVGETR